jgi:hypothetical protein
MEWFKAHPELAWWIVAVSALMFVGTLIAIPVLLARMPADYFLHSRRDAVLFSRQHPALRLTLLAAKNAVGLMFLLAGVVMLLTPGQGILSILLGITLLDFPGKRRLELAIVRRPHVLKAINWVRAKAHRPALQLPRREE